MLINAALIGDTTCPPFLKNFRKDLTSTDIEIVGADRYVIAELAPKEGCVLIIKTIIPYAQKRTNVGVVLPATPAEDFEMISAVEGNGHFLFQPEINQGATLIEFDANKAAPLGATALNLPSEKQSAIDCISENPYRDALLSLDSTVFHILVNDSARFRVVFTLAETTMSGKIVIGGSASNHRVDFAGVYIGGAEIAKQSYDEMVRRARAAK